MKNFKVKTKICKSALGINVTMDFGDINLKTIDYNSFLEINTGKGTKTITIFISNKKGEVITSGTNSVVLNETLVGSNITVGDQVTVHYYNNNDLLNKPKQSGDGGIAGVITCV